MATVLDEPTARVVARRGIPRRRRSARRMMAARWLAVLFLGIVSGAALVMLADPGTSAPSVLVNAPRGRRAGRPT